MTRADILLGDATRDHRILEIGPSYNPTVTRADGWSVQSVDHAAKPDLQAKYQAWGIDTSRLEDVDHIWTGGPLHAAIPAPLHGTFDLVIASHVIEHIPDMLGFLRSASSLLAPQGRLALAIPDKRFGFDYFRPSTLTSDIMERHERGASRHSYKTLFETYFYNANAAGAIGWHGAPPDPVAIHHGWQVGRDAFNGTRANPAGFVDAHASCFTPASFQLILLELAALAATDLAIIEFHQPEDPEFFAILDRSGPAILAWPEPRLMARRTELLRAMLEETHAQFELLRTVPRALP